MNNILSNIRTLEKIITELENNLYTEQNDLSIMLTEITLIATSNNIEVPLILTKDEFKQKVVEIMQEETDGLLVGYNILAGILELEAEYFFYNRMDIYETESINNRNLLALAVMVLEEL